MNVTIFKICKKQNRVHAVTGFVYENETIWVLEFPYFFHTDCLTCILKDILELMCTETGLSETEYMILITLSRV